MHPATVLLLACGLLLARAAQAQSVALAGILGTRALLVVDNSPPKSVGVGEMHRGVRVVSTQANQAVIEVAGMRQTLRLGDSPMSANSANNSSGDNKIVLHAVTNGHFMAQGQINGRTASFIVDTGASYVAMSVADAQRIGLDYRSGQPVYMNTANGVSTGWRLKLASVRLGSVDVYDVDAVVSPAPMPYILLGNSYLTRFQMTRTNDQLVLEKRY